MLVRCRGLSVVYGAGAGVAKPFTSVTFDVDRGESVAITGPSGSGKSTVIRLISGLQSPKSGSVVIDGVKMTTKNSAQLRRKHIGVVYQDYRLVPFLTAFENVKLPLELLNITSAGADDIERMLESLGIGHLRDRAAHSLSGGEQQRVGIARALITKPALILADEPTGALDQAASRLIAEIFQKLTVDHGVSVIVATHDPEVAATMDRVLTFESGRIESAAQ